jgi:hypothetical protein
MGVEGVQKTICLDCFFQQTERLEEHLRHLLNQDKKMRSLQTRMRKLECRLARKKREEVAIYIVYPCRKHVQMFVGRPQQGGISYRLYECDDTARAAEENLIMEQFVPYGSGRPEGLT